MNFLEDNATDAAKKIALLSTSMDATVNDFETYSKGINDVLKDIGFTEEEILAI